MSENRNNFNGLSRKIANRIKKINPGVLIDTRKTCPLIGKQCIGVDCLGFTPNFGINVVSWEESLKLKQEDDSSGLPSGNWINKLIHGDWELDSEIIDPKLHSLDETTYIFTFKPTSNTFGRCISIGRK